MICFHKSDNYLAGRKQFSSPAFYGWGKYALSGEQVNAPFEKTSNGRGGSEKNLAFQAISFMLRPAVR
jgi:hypothetical protein